MVRGCTLCGDKAVWHAPRTPVSVGGRGGLWAFLCDRHYDALPHKLGHLLDRRSVVAEAPVDHPRAA